MGWWPGGQGWRQPTNALQGTQKFEHSREPTNLRIQGNPEICAFKGTHKFAHSREPTTLPTHGNHKNLQGRAFMGAHWAFDWALWSSPGTWPGSPGPPTFDQAVGGAPQRSTGQSTGPPGVRPGSRPGPPKFDRAVDRAPPQICASAGPQSCMQLVTHGVLLALGTDMMPQLCR